MELALFLHLIELLATAEGPESFTSGPAEKTCQVELGCSIIKLRWGVILG